MDPHKNLQLFFSLCNPANPTNAINVKDLNTNTPWDEFLDYCIAHSVAPYLYDRLNKHGMIERLPEGVKNSLKQVFLTNSMLVMLARSQFTEIMNCMNEKNIPVIPLKGIYLSEKVFSASPARMMSDIDLLFKKEDIIQAQKEMANLGYTQKSKQWESPGHHLPPFYRPKTHFAVELHWQLIPPSRMRGLSHQAIWSRARKTTVAGNPCFELDPVHTLIHICQHVSYQHFFANGLKAICDIDAIIRFFDSELDWQDFLANTRAIHGENGILLTLRLAQLTLDTPLPASIQQAIADCNFPPEVIEEAFTSMSVGKEFPDAPPESWQEMITWGIGKFGKIINQIRDSHIPSKGDAAQTPSINRIAYILNSNIEAAKNAMQKKQANTAEKSQRHLRRWLSTRL